MAYYYKKEEDTKRKEITQKDIDKIKQYIKNGNLFSEIEFAMKERISYYTIKKIATDNKLNSIENIRKSIKNNAKLLSAQTIKAKKDIYEKSINTSIDNLFEDFRDLSKAYYKLMNDKVTMDSVFYIRKLVKNNKKLKTNNAKLKDKVKKYKKTNEITEEE